jgi:RNA polymerase-binding transcription factor DksA
MTRKLNPEDLNRYRSLLRHVRRELFSDIGELEDDAFPRDGGVRATGDDVADLGSDGYAKDFSLDLLARDKATLGEVDEALGRLQSGNFGRCEGCQARIPKVRLNALPHARKCIDCQREAERI